MKTYSIDYTLHGYLEDQLEKFGAFKNGTYFVLSLGERSSFYSLKDIVIKAFGPDALQQKAGTYRYFILFKNMEKQEIIDKLNDRLDMFGEYWRDDDLAEFDRNGTKYYITKITFED